MSFLGLILTAAKTAVAGAALIAGGVLLVAAAQANAAQHFAPDAMPRRHVRVADLGVAFIGILLVVGGVVQLVS